MNEDLNQMIEGFDWSILLIGVTQEGASESTVWRLLSVTFLSFKLGCRVVLTPTRLARVSAIMEMIPRMQAAEAFFLCVMLVTDVFEVNTDRCQALGALGTR